MLAVNFVVAPLSGFVSQISVIIALIKCILT